MLLPTILPRPLRFLLLMGLGLGLSGCLFNERGLNSPFVVAREGLTPIQEEPVVLVATTRRAAPGMRSPYFTADRGPGLSFAEARLNPPDRSITGSITAAVASPWTVNALAGVSSSGAAGALSQSANGKDVLIYVHGFNETFETAVASAAQLSDAIAWSGRTALFTWPSGGRLIAYQYDRESAMWSRDGFEEALKALASNPTIGRVHIVAHSMGTLLTLETLRQLRSEAGEAVMNRVGAIVLASPDIDIDQFEQTVRKLGPAANRITVISATNDRALAVSSRLAGGIARAGSAERERLDALGVRVADASSFGGNLQIIRHDLFLSDHEVRQVIGRAIERAR
ncbi:MAG: alpha/beta hydrolase [Bosea sp.]|jgi:esterase/lipase superfamily enzyme|nr:alpha/beta hydrolase [Bosea sp. (in: a-proteobacteria)]